MNDVTRHDIWARWRGTTQARIGLGRSGDALPTAPLLEFQAAHSRARDAVHGAADFASLAAALAPHPVLRVHSQAADRATYLRRPDLGRRLGEHASLRQAGRPVALVIADGLSATAVQSHAVPLIRKLAEVSPERWQGAPAAIALQARVALGDEVGERLGAQLVLVLIGERPGLSSPDSLGCYLTFAPRVGRTDAERNCVSNIRPQGLGYEAAARRIDWLAAAALARGLTGVALKDESLGLPT